MLKMEGAAGTRCDVWFADEMLYVKGNYSLTNVELWGNYISAQLLYFVTLDRMRNFAVVLQNIFLSGSMHLSTFGTVSDLLWGLATDAQHTGIHIFMYGLNIKHQLRKWLTLM